MTARFAWGFVAGFLAVPLGHQIMLALMHGIGFTGFPPWQMTPVPLFGVPTVLSQSFWGGVWGIVFALIEPHVPQRPVVYWPCVALFGGIVLTLVFIVAVMPLKGVPPTSDPPAVGLTLALLVNGAWGVVAALLLKLSRLISR